MGKLKAYSINLDGRHEVLVAAKNQSEAARLFGVSNYAMGRWLIGCNDHDMTIAMSDPGKVFIKRGINGEWAPREKGSV